MKRAVAATRRRAKARGITLIELMVVVGLVGVLAALAIGFSGDWRRRNDHRKLTREAFNALNVARATALKKGKRVSVQLDSTAFLGGLKHIVVFDDADSDQIFDSSETIHLQFPSDRGTIFDDLDTFYDADMTIASVQLAAAHAGNQTAIFDHQGFLISASGAPLAASDILVHDARTGRTYTVDVTIAGAIAIDPP